jgi:hypothetical protein
LPNDVGERKHSGIMCGQTNDEFAKLCEFHEINVDTYKGEQSKIKIARNLVDYSVGKTILEYAIKSFNSTEVEQIGLFK